MTAPAVNDESFMRGRSHMPYAKYTKNLPVSCDKCGHTTQNVGSMKLHAKIKHEMSQVDGKPPWLKLYIKKYYTFESTCNYIRLILIF